MGEPGNAIANFEVLGDFGTDFYDSAAVIATDGAAFALLGESANVDVLPVSRVERDRVDLNKDIVISHLGQRHFLYFGLAYVDDLDRLHGLG
jgi:hypothetical protein